MDWAQVLAVVVLALASVVGLALTLVALPGNWLMVLAGVGVWAWRPELVGGWVIAWAVVLAVVGEGVELLASSLGAARAGSTRRGQVGALVGGIVGGIAGSPFPPVLGAVIWGVVGAGLGAMLAERYWARRGADDSIRAGGGAAVGRLAAVVGKTGLGAVIAVVLMAAALLA